MKALNAVRFGIAATFAVSALTAARIKRIAIAGTAPEAEQPVGDSAALAVPEDGSGLQEVEGATLKNSSATVGRREILSLQNLALFVSSALILLSVVRVYYFSGFSTTVALEILSVADRANILVGTLLACLVTFSPLVFLTGHWRLAERITKLLRVPDRVPTWLILLPLLPLALVGLPLAVICAYVPLAVDASTRTFWAKVAGSKMVSVPWGRSRAFVVAGVVAALTCSILFQPWQPLERIFQTKPTKEWIVGYVIGEQAERLLVIDGDSRTASWIKTDAIEKREVCGRSGELEWWTMSWADLMTHNNSTSCDF